MVLLLFSFVLKRVTTNLYAPTSLFPPHTLVFSLWSLPTCIKLSPSSGLALAWPHLQAGTHTRQWGLGSSSKVRLSWRNFCLYCRPKGLRRTLYPEPWGHTRQVTSLVYFQQAGQVACLCPELLPSWVAGKHPGVPRPTPLACVTVGWWAFVPASPISFPNLLALVFDLFPQVLGLLLSELGFSISAPEATHSF